MARRRTVGEILVGQILGNPARDVLANTGNHIQRGNFWGHKGPYLETRVANLLQTYHTAVWPGDGQWVKFWSVKFWATQLEKSLQTQETLSKGAIFGVTKAHISRLLTRVANLLQTFHKAVWPGDGQWVKFWSVKFWATQLEMSLQTQETLSKGAILGVTKAHISRLEWPTCFKLFTQLYGQETDSG